MTAALLPEDAPLIRIHEKGGKEKIILANDREALNRAQISRLPPDLKSLPLVVLINQTTAAGAEIVAGVWQGYGRAMVIGTPSFGKNTIETLRLLEGRSDTYLKHTTSNWVYPDGKSVAGRGVKPDVQLEESDLGGEAAMKLGVSHLAGTDDPIRTCSSGWISYNHASGCVMPTDESHSW